MCVADVCSDDIESVETILSSLNGIEPSWMESRGQRFTEEEVILALRELMRLGFISPVGPEPGENYITDISIETVGTEGYEFDQLWFRLRQTGRDAIDRWLESGAEERFGHHFD
ncbi:MAG: hypothetical protein ACI89L_001567 [Phycisphaerales bacterium]|jgi:hypothetical protein